MDNAAKERESRQKPHKVHIVKAHREWSYREREPSYGEMLEDGFGATRREEGE